ncbi:hypothetical protein FKW77_005068 [Venturia effusa]|uniref:Uncharacterized protein n=1 Tax=Venturia effusa TaxID=50376 RepID=A0A517KWA6_9PEZI|nr:hypothetical protein FKW77_005068 [Venturia effusa]
MHHQKILLVLAQHEDSLHGIWRESNAKVVQRGRSRKEILQHYSEPLVNDSMERAMHAIQENRRGPNFLSSAEAQTYFDAMEKIQSRTEEFLSQYEHGDEQLRLSGLVEDDSNSETKTAAKAVEQDQVVNSHPDQRTECRYFPRKHHITGEKIGWTEKKIYLQHKKHISAEYARILAKAPQLLCKGRTKEEILIYVTAVFQDLSTAAKIAAALSELFSASVFLYYKQIHDGILSLQSKYLALASDHLASLYDSERESIVKEMSEIKTYEWDYIFCKITEEGFMNYLRKAQEEINKLLESTGAHIEIIKMSHQEDEAYCAWEVELIALFSERKARTGKFMLKQEDMALEEMKMKLEKRHK